MNEPARCPLCMAPLEMRVTREDKTEARFVFLVHTVESCQAMVRQRIVVLQEGMGELLKANESQRLCIDELARWIGMMSHICDTGGVWLELRKKRVEHIERLREAFGPGERRPEDPLWTAEKHLAELITMAVGMVTMTRGGGNGTTS